jgi:hypothetical protein
MFRSRWVQSVAKIIRIGNLVDGNYYWSGICCSSPSGEEYGHSRRWADDHEVPVLGLNAKICIAKTATLPRRGMSRFLSQVSTGKLESINTWAQVREAFHVTITTSTQEAIDFLCANLQQAEPFPLDRLWIAPRID